MMMRKRIRIVKKMIALEKQYKIVLLFMVCLLISFLEENTRTLINTFKTVSAMKMKSIFE